MSELTATRARYARFARDEAPGRSELYEAWAHAVLEDDELASVLARIPATHRQPPLVFAVARMLGCPHDAGERWRWWVLAHADELVAECAVRSIQTNEPLRCAALLPALGLIEGPIALLEIGASAGLCLYPDRYSYRYGTADGVLALDPVEGESAPVLSSRLRGAPGVALPTLALPEIVWRAGIDLAPLDARSGADRDWLTGLVWPGETGRAERIAAALGIAAADPPLLVAGDGVEVLAELAARAPTDATLVVTTPGVLPHVPRSRRAELIDLARAAGRWITMDAPGTHDGWRPSFESSGWPADAFALALDGEVLAAVDPLGSWVEWRRVAPGSRR